jgi:hypothetical protein
VRGFSDGFRDSGDNILIQDSFVLLCSAGDDHSDGLQGYRGGSNVVIRHTTIDQREVDDPTAPIFISDGSDGIVAENNLLAGGSYTLRMYGDGFVAKGNRIVDDSWMFGPADNDCGGIEWSDNKIVRIDKNYKVTKVVRTLGCD